MRAVLVVSLLALFCPAAMAQTAPAAPAPRAGAARSGDIPRDQYIERAVERARRNAEARFDRMDTNHDAVLTAGERRAALAQRRASPTQ